MYHKKYTLETELDCILNCLDLRSYVQIIVKQNVILNSLCKLF